MADLSLFDAPAAWRAVWAQLLGLTGEALVGAVAPGAAFPMALRPLAAGLAAGPGDLVLDVGAGLGGASVWLAGATGATVVAVEPAAGSAFGAAQLFPSLPVVQGDATALPVPKGQVAAVTLLGVLSLVDDALPALTEARRVLRAGGRIGISDLFLADGAELRPPSLPNTFRSLPALLGACASLGLRPLELGVGDPTLTTSWHDRAGLVDALVEHEHAGEDAFARFAEDRRRLGELLASGRLLAGTVVLADTA